MKAEAAVVDVTASNAANTLGECSPMELIGRSEAKDISLKFLVVIL
jgi:hypothetical protein